MLERKYCKGKDVREFRERERETKKDRELA